MPTPSSLEGTVGIAVQSALGTPATAFKTVKMLRFSWTPDVTGDEEGEPEIGGSMDVAAAMRYGHQGATFTGELRFRPGNAGLILRAFGMAADDGKYVFYPGVNDTIVVKEDAGAFVPVNILTGTGHSAVAYTPYTAVQVGTHLKAVLDANTTLAGTYTVSFAANKFTIAVAGGPTGLTLGWTQAACNMGELLGFNTSADDTGAATYTGDYNADWAIRHVFTPIAGQTNFPWLTFYDSMDGNNTLDTLLYDARVRSVTLNAEANNVLRVTFEGRAMNFQDATGSETFTADDVLCTEPTTSNSLGSLYFPTENYCMQRLSAELTWAENILPCLTDMAPAEIVAGRRSAKGSADVMLGAEASAGLFRKVYYGSSAGTEPSTTIVQQMMHVDLRAGQPITNLNVTNPEYYGVILHSEETRLLTYPLEKSGDAPITGGLTFQIYKGATAWCLVLVNNYATGYYD